MGLQMGSRWAPDGLQLSDGSGRHCAARVLTRMPSPGPSALTSAREFVVQYTTYDNMDECMDVVVQYIHMDT